MNPVVFAMSDAQWATLGSVAAAMIGGPLIVVVKKVMDHDAADTRVAEAVATLTVTVDKQGERLEHVAETVDRVERRLDAHIDRKGETS